VENMMDENFPRNYDLCVTMISASELQHFEPSADEFMQKNYPEIYGTDEIKTSSPWNLILVYAQWIDLGEKDPDLLTKRDEWFAKIKDCAGSRLILGNQILEIPVSQLTKGWIFGNVREFPEPYEKRTFLTHWTHELKENGWTNWVSDRIDKIAHDSQNGCKLAIQIQSFGGKNSKFRTNGDDSTAYSWRDTTIVCVMDCFYDPDEKTRITANDWQETNDKEVRKYFCNEDRRVLWGSYGSHDLSDPKVHKCYYEPRKFDKLVRIKKNVDPQEIFSPNLFCVTANHDSLKKEIDQISGSGVLKNKPERFNRKDEKK